MKIFLPFKKDLNPYLEEIIKYSKHDFEYGNFKECPSNCPVINIHWPEAIFNWQEPTVKQLSELESVLSIWKSHASIVYTKHDESRHKGMTPNFTRLFNLIENNTDVFIHLGDFSKTLYKSKYPKAKHTILVHPLYESSFHQFSKKEAREKLNINQDAVVIIVPGSIRNLRERNLVLKAFKRLKQKNKVLIATSMRSEIRFDFRGRIKLKGFFNVRDYVVNKFKSSYSPPEYLFTYKKLDAQDLALKVSSADIVLIPRVKILNSGILFLGLTFNKLVVGPDSGNITEFLKSFKFPIFDPKSARSATRALKDAIALLETNYEIPLKDTSQFQPSQVAKNMDALFLKLK